MADIVEVDDGPQLPGLLILAGGRVVGGKHDLFAGDARLFGQQQFRQGAAIRAEAFLLENPEDERIGQGFDGEEFLETGYAGERGLEQARVLANRLFVVNVKRRRVPAGDLGDLFQREG